LERLARWERFRVTVTSFTRRPSHPMLAFAHTTMHGRLGAAELGGSWGCGGTTTSAFFRLGAARAGDSPQNGFTLYSKDFVAAVELSNTKLEIECDGGLRIVVELG
jgi:hypothetical protein